MTRWVVSLTTIPSRIDSCQETLLSILRDQVVKPDKVYLHVPLHYENSFRDKERPDVSIPLWLQHLETTYKNILIVTRPLKDHGPITKLYETLLLEPDPNTRIVTIDDDFVYSPLLIKTLKEYAQDENTCYGFSGFIFYNDRGIIKRPRQHLSTCQVLEGFAGVTYRRGHFKDSFSDIVRSIQECPDAKFSDDVIIGNYLEQEQVHRRIVSSADINALQLLKHGSLPHGDAPDALKYSMTPRYISCFQWLEKHKCLYLHSSFREARRMFQGSRNVTASLPISKPSRVACRLK